jgi:hypothetical protein
MKDERLTVEEHQTLTSVVDEANEKAWGIGIGLMLAIGLFVATNVLVIKGGSNVGTHLQLLQVYFPGYSVTFAGSLIGFVYAFVLGYLSGRVVVLLYSRLARWIQ